jgi:hypothetical protein
MELYFITNEEELTLRGYPQWCGLGRRRLTVGAGVEVKTGAGVDGEVQGTGGKLMAAPTRSKRGRRRLSTVGTPRV